MTLERLFNENFASKIICLNAGNQLLGYFLPSTDMLPITSLRSIIFCFRSAIFSLYNTIEFNSYNRV